MNVVKLFLKNKIFYVSILISILIHVLLLFGFADNSEKIILLAANQSKYTLINYTIKDNIFKNKLNSITENIQSNENSTSLKKAGSGRQTSLSKDGAKQILRTYEQSILKKIHKNKYYPLIAKKRQLIGVIKLKFVLARDGSLVNNIQILDKCKYPVLNLASLKTIQRSSPFSPFPDEIKSRQKIFIVKIKYQQDLL